MRTRTRLTSLLMCALCMGAAVVILLGPKTGPRQPDAAQPGPAVVLPAADDAPVTDSQAQEVPVDFAREVLPILSENCLLCHGPDQDSDEAKEAGFRLDIAEEAIGFEMIVPGNAQESLVYQVITTDRRSQLMPPVDSGKSRLTDAQVDVIRRWIDQGAVYTDHWAYVSPQRPELPQIADPQWASNEIDLFVYDRLAQSGLTPSDPADRHRLLRRVYLDLIGLPPTPQQVDAFINDTSPTAYESVVDELLASPRFGEHWARQWLDNARYADSQGFEKDSPRTMWRYRDWVIQAFNDDMPFDQFTRDQIAGDLLEEPTLEQLIATGFHRNTMTNTEGGTDDEEFRAAAVIDRVNTTMEVWMGVTMGCVQCHTHKYDPILHEEYFQIYAFFNQSEDADRYNDAPFIPAPLPEHEAEVQRLEALVAEARRAVAEEQASAPQEPAAPQPALAQEGEASVEAEEAVEPEPTALQQRLTQLEEQLNNYRRRIPRALIMRDLTGDARRETYLFQGGSFLAPDTDGGIIEPGTPAVLHDYPQGAPPNRLGLAQWLTDEHNPLTARVQANRIWEQLWGVGLVDTSNDFGFQGSYPSNKDLLDYLAVSYQQDMAWSTKSLIRLIVTSSTYQQSAEQTPEMREIDPFNRLMTRGPRLRLTAEQIRDQALAVGGILDTDRIGGPSVTPYMPEGGLPQAFDNYVQRQSQGADLYRRGLYTDWRRTGHYPSFATFDAPARDICVVTRSRTNTPLQALTTLNDPVYIEAAQALGRRMLTEVGDDLDTQLAYGVNLALAREPSALELQTLRMVYTQSLAEFEQDAEAAVAMATLPRGPLPAGMDVAQAAAMTHVGNVLLNLDELINKP